MEEEQNKKEVVKETMMVTSIDRRRGSQGQHNKVKWRYDSEEVATIMCSGGQDG